MRSRLICALVSAAFVATCGTARADTTRIRISIDDIPRQDKPIEVDPKSAVLPNGAHELGPVPKGWHERDPAVEAMELAHCTDDRRGSVSTMYGGATSTERIWEANGKVWFDRADVETKMGYVHVTRAERVPLVRIADGIWAYRHAHDVQIVLARDAGFIEEGASFECRIWDHTLGAPVGTTVIASSPQSANLVMRQMERWDRESERKPPRRPDWTGVELRVMASVSKAESDPAPMLSLVIRRP